MPELLAGMGYSPRPYRGRDAPCPSETSDGMVAIEPRSNRDAATLEPLSRALLMLNRHALTIVAILASVLSACEWGANSVLEPPVQHIVATSNRPPREANHSRPSNFYSRRLATGITPLEAPSSPRTGINEDELDWVSTAQDYQVALMVSRETGFDTWGVESAVAEVPPGRHTGRHRHGEEAMYIVSGRGLIEVDGIGYEFEAGTTIGIPYGAAHRIFNTGNETIRYVSGTAAPLETFVGLYMMEQLETRGQSDTPPAVEISHDGYDPRGRRIVMHWRDAEYRDGGVSILAALKARLLAGVWLKNEAEGAAPRASNWQARVATGLGHHSAWVRLMGGNGEGGFDNKFVTMSHMLVEAPGTHSGKHAHMDAILYVVQGDGYSIVDGEKVEWRAGSSLRIRGPQTPHQHFNTSDEPSYLLRIASGLRPYFQEAVEDVYPYLWYEAQGAIDD